MLITEVVGNIRDLATEELASLTQEKVRMGNLDLVKRVQRTTTDAGNEIGLRMPTGFREFHHGDILFRDETRIITIDVAPTDVLVLRPETVEDMAFLAHSLGNRHMQAQFFGPESEYGQGVMVVQYDHTVEDFLKHHNAIYTREERVMPHPFRHAEHTH